MKEIEVSSIDELIRLLNEFPNSFIYRGQSNADWQLESSLERIIGDRWCTEQVRKFEDFSLDEFKTKFHIYDKENIVPKSKLAWLAAMQHYGIPTRLLDFTSSPYIALYFALEFYDSKSNPDIGLVAVNYTSAMDRSLEIIKQQAPNFQETRKTVYEKQDEIFDSIVDPNQYDVIWVMEPKELNVRLDRQAGCFMASGNPALRIADVLKSRPYQEVEMVKLRVDRSLYSGVFALLRKMNITSKCLYGDLDGLARSIRMQMQIYAQ